MRPKESNLPRGDCFYKIISHIQGSSIITIESERDAVTTREHSFASGIPGVPKLTIYAGTPEEDVLSFALAMAEAGRHCGHNGITRGQNKRRNMTWTFDAKGKVKVEDYLRKNFGLERNDIDV